MEGFLGWLIMAVLFVAPLWKICARAGFAPALSLVAAIPVLGLAIVAAVVGFAEWPSLRRAASR